MTTTEAELRKLVARLGVRPEDSGGDITRIGDNNQVTAASADELNVIAAQMVNAPTTDAAAAC